MNSSDRGMDNRVIADNSENVTGRSRMIAKRCVKAQS